jgi:polysaccharide export outer membrane protein
MRHYRFPPSLGGDSAMLLPPLRRLALAALAFCATGCATSYIGVDVGGHAATSFPNIGYAAWTDSEPPYRIYPGDLLDISIPSAPELSKTVTVQPDGRVSLQLIHQVMAADRTTGELERALDEAYASQLVRPEVFVDVKSATPLKVFVGGEVDKPGVYDMPGDINALQAVIEAGGFRPTARKTEVIIIRRGPDGRAMMRTADLAHGIAVPGRSDLVPLRRFDIVYVPPTGLAKAGMFMSQVKDLIPGNVGFDYAITNNTKIF